MPRAVQWWQPITTSPKRKVVLSPILTEAVCNVLRHVPKDQLVVVSMHIPLTNHEMPDSPADTTSDRHRLLSLLAERPHTVSFSGHSHKTEHHFLDAGHGFTRSRPHHHQMLTAACGSWWSGPRDHRGIPVAMSRDGSPKGFHVLSDDANRYTTLYVAADAAAHTQMHMFVAKPRAAAGMWQIGCQLGCKEVSDAQVYVDVFDGSALTEVTLTVSAAHAPIRLKRVFHRNPVVTEFFARQARLCKTWVEASGSSHLWCAPLPPYLAPGVYRLSAQAVDQFGREHVTQLILELTS